MNWPVLGLAFMLAAVLGSAVGVVYSKHQSRKYFVELQGQNEARDELNVEWGRLQLEQSTWATHGRIERSAREKLHMALPKPDETVVIQP